MNSDFPIQSIEAKTIQDEGRKLCHEWLSTLVTSETLTVALGLVGFLVLMILPRRCLT